MIRRRRPLARAAMVGGAAYYAGKRTSERQAREEEQEYRLQQLEGQQAQPYAPPPPQPAAPSGDMIAQLEQLAQLKDRGVLTAEEFEAQKRRILQG